MAALTAAVLLAAPAQTAPKLKKVTPKGVGKVKVGKSYKFLRKKKAIGKIRSGCELGGPMTRSAPLRKPLRGSVEFTPSEPRKARSITVRKGARARGVGIGAPLEKIIERFPKAKVIHDTEETFGITLVKIPKKGGGKLDFAVDVESGKVTLIGIPYIAFCE